jgi:hypothetical protein
MDLHDKMLFVLIWSILLVPAAVLIWSWWKHTRLSDPMDRLSSVSLALVTVSYAFLWVAAFYRPLLGPDYSTRLNATILLNLCANVLVGLVTLFRRRPWGGKVCISGVSGLVALAWFYVLAVNQTV